LLNFLKYFKKMESVVLRQKESVVDERFVVLQVISQVEFRRVDGLEQGFGVVVHDGRVDSFDGVNAFQVRAVGIIHLDRKQFILKGRIFNKC